MPKIRWRRLPRGIKEHLRNRSLLERIDAAYGDGPDPGERRLRRSMRRQQRRLVQDRW